MHISFSWKAISFVVWSRISKSGCIYFSVTDRASAFLFDILHKWIPLSWEVIDRQGDSSSSLSSEFSLQYILCDVSVFIHSSFYYRNKCHQTASSASSLELFIVSGDKQSLRVIHAALRCTIRLVEHFLTHSWLPPSYYDSEAQGEKSFRLQSIISVCVCVCVMETELIYAFCTQIL